MLESVSLIEALERYAISTFGFSDSPDALFALKMLGECFKPDTPADWQALFEKSNWDDTLSSFRTYVSSLGATESEVGRLTARLPTWRMVYQLEAMPSPGTGMEEAAVRVERLGYEPVDLGSVFHQNHLYYPIETLVTTHQREASGQLKSYERVDVVVVRSDRTLHTQVESAPGEKSGGSTPIYRLTDGTLLRERLTATQHATWSWESVNDYLQQQNEAPVLSELVVKIHQYLRAKIWLPDPDDYWLLTFIAVLSYVQAIFEAVPIVLLNGVGGSGKSGLGTALANISCNATVIGNSSASSMIRLMNETNGLVVIDDLESIGAAAGKDKFSEMVQVLKVSYTKATATKLVTNSRRKPQMMSFFGVKVISNTSGVDSILGSRMLHVKTLKMPPTEIDAFLSRPGVPAHELKALRDALHRWAFENVASISERYDQLASTSTQREQEISIPLVVLAELSGVAEAVESLERAISDQRHRKQHFSNPEDALKHVAESCARKGMIEVSVAEISLRLRQTLGGKSPTKERAVWLKPEWISKKLRSLDLVEDWGGRKVLYGYQSRTVRLSSAVIARAGVGSIYQSSVQAFCEGCQTCPFKNLGCEIMPYRIKKEGRIHRQPQRG